VGVQRQYSGTAGRIENTQVLVCAVWATARGAAFVDHTRLSIRCSRLRLAHRVDIASRFTPAKSSRAKQLADTDPRLAEALRHEETAALPAVLGCARS
jgi:hypothetical protein